MVLCFFISSGKISRRLRKFNQWTHQLPEISNDEQRQGFKIAAKATVKLWMQLFFIIKIIKNHFMNYKMS